MSKNIDSTECKHLSVYATIGEFTIGESLSNSNNYWVTHEDGEGTEVPKRLVNDTLKKLFYEVL